MTSWLVLDGAHRLGHGGLAADLGRLIEQAPYNAHFVVASRSDAPFAIEPFLLNDTVARIGRSDLAFDDEQARSLLSQLGLDRLGDEQLAHLVERVGGWPAGLQLVAQSARSPAATSEEQPTSWLRPHAFDHVAAYLATEVFAGMAEDELRFLCESSVLDDPSPELCDHVLGRTDSKQVLDRLALEGLFTTVIDHHPRRYRYHEMFRDVLRERLMSDPGRTEELFGAGIGLVSKPRRCGACSRLRARW